MLVIILVFYLPSPNRSFKDIEKSLNKGKYN
jgi:hypothetical protein